MYEYVSPWVIVGVLYQVQNKCFGIFSLLILHHVSNFEIYSILVLSWEWLIFVFFSFITVFSVIWIFELPLAHIYSCFPISSFCLFPIFCFWEFIIKRLKSTRCYFYDICDYLLLSPRNWRQVPMAEDAELEQMCQRVWAGSDVIASSQSTNFSSNGMCSASCL